MDAYDPWMQWAWGELLEEEGRQEEGSKHLSVAAQVLTLAAKGQQEKGINYSVYLRGPLKPSSRHGTEALIQWLHKESKRMALAAASAPTSPNTLPGLERHGKGVPLNQRSIDSGESVQHIPIPAKGENKQRSLQKKAKPGASK